MARPPLLCPLTPVARLAQRRAAPFLGGGRLKQCALYRRRRGLFFLASQAAAWSACGCLRAPPLFSWRWLTVAHSYHGCPLGFGVQTPHALKVQPCDPCATGLRATRRPAASVDSEHSFLVCFGTSKKIARLQGHRRGGAMPALPRLYCKPPSSSGDL